ncbi:biotin synthase BioB [Desulfomonile tiedjei]|uniref:Biotin synthase n=1 Tax=Desulfomonile tiedjei (strain ATCC 49306 / DSM 6799 / DCB-1) TaxID=706587 RepID=I4C2V7_DESTA|nr:biotin synthase BioB [Desulfomonile tiedjei]AFM23898.1 biotin synthase [Desulfomonile tiedjei DSM 6799]
MITQEISFYRLINSIEEKILDAKSIEQTEARKLLQIPDEFLMHLLAAADRIRIAFKGSKFDSCSLINAKSGRCSEDCAFCAQSGHHHGECDVYGLKSGEEILLAAQKAREAGASRFCTVTSGGALSAKEFDTLIQSLERVRAEVDIHLDASLGFLDNVRAERLAAAGVTRYNHNLETSRDYYGQIVTTHHFDQRVDTVRTVMHHGFSACSGGIIGMGETPDQRLDLAFTLADLGVDCVPINILNPRKGTPLYEVAQPEPLEILKTIAIFRLILPKATIKVAGGRERNLTDFQAMALRSGANGMIVGGYLTTGGRSLEDDVAMIRKAGYTMD